jgi:hypothetical protein
VHQYGPDWPLVELAAAHATHILAPVSWLIFSSAYCERPGAPEFDQWRVATNEVHPVQRSGIAAHEQDGAGPGSYFVRIKDGKIVEMRSHPDVAGLAAQLGLTPGT